MVVLLFYNKDFLSQCLAAKIQSKWRKKDGGKAPLQHKSLEDGTSLFDFEETQREFEGKTVVCFSNSSTIFMNHQSICGFYAISI